MDTREQSQNRFQIDNYKIWAWDWLLDYFYIFRFESDDSYKKNSYKKKCMYGWYRREKQHRCYWIAW